MMDPAVFLGLTLGVATDPMLAILSAILGYNVRRWWLWLLGCIAIGVLASFLASVMSQIPYDHWGVILYARMAAAFLWGCVARGIGAAKSKLADGQSSSGSD